MNQPHTVLRAEKAPDRPEASTLFQVDNCFMDRLLKPHLALPSKQSGVDGQDVGGELVSLRQHVLVGDRSI